ncbi:EF-hand domain-containing protein [Solimonas marina]|uniref:EF-hand domain-containing protein n=1 Tax=Solimonas marina TaxID=2714601 RepID=A0A969WAT8_9GAMM|nr:EF-hand domain-containing protein [Solimonas marina]NKF21480.1 EF-hand domain-containing protein [Solimonas marina]
MRYPLVAIALVAPTMAFAATPSRAEQMAAKLDQRFQQADTNHDGKLSPDEAKAGMPRLAKNFQAIDSNGDGAVTESEITAFMQSKAANR